jgi:hypothetical protein
MTNNKQQTALHRYSRGVGELVSQLIGNRITGKQFVMLEIKLMDECKEIEKDQKLNMFNCGRQYQVTGEGTFKQVYQEIYGGGEQ